MTLKNKMLMAVIFGCCILNCPAVWGQEQGLDDKQIQQEKIQKEFEWWPTDAQPAPVKDEKSGGYWWWPTQPGQARPWGNRGYIYVYKIIYDYKASDEDLAPKPQEMRPSLLVKKIIKNIKIYFDYNKAELRDDHVVILNNAVKTLQRNLETDILITGNCDARGSSEYNLKLGKKRGAAVEQFMIDQGIPSDRIKIVSRGKLDAAAPMDDLDGMQKDRNAQFVIAEVEEIMIPAGSYPEESDARIVEEGKYIVEKDEEVESTPKVSTREYTIKKNDSLWKIAASQMGNGNRWKYLYELNKDRIKNPSKLKVGQVITIPVE